MTGKSIKMSMKELIKYAPVPRKRDKKTHRPYILLAVVVIMMWLVGCKSTGKVVKKEQAVKVSDIDRASREGMGIKNYI